MADLADAYSRLLTNPFVPLSYMPFARPAAAGCDLFYRLGKRYGRQAFGITSTPLGGRHVAVVEEIVADRPFCKLRHFRKIPASGESPTPAQPTVLLVAPMAGHHPTLLRDTVRELLRDHDVILTDWIDARLVPVSAGSFSLGDYIGYIQDFIRLLGPDLHVVAICQSTVPVLAAVSLMASEDDPALPTSMTMIGGPIDTRKSPTQVNHLATTRPLSWFTNAMIHTVPYGYPGFGRRVYPGFIQHACFVSMHAWQHADSHRDFYQRRCQGEPAERHCAFYDEYNAVLDIPEELYIETIEAVFQECWLARGIWKIGSRVVRPQDIKTVALLTVEGDRDDITGPGQTAAAHQLCSGIPDSKKINLVATDCGHYCIFSGHRWRQVIYPKIRSFIRACDPLFVRTHPGDDPATGTAHASPGRHELASRPLTGTEAHSEFHSISALAPSIHENQRL
jgi:poly(3-hydroxybutyrate) depolymerase